MGIEILPDSRCIVRRGSKFDARFGCNVVPAFCANCGREWGVVPETHMTSVMVLCDGCEDKGGIAFLMKCPEEVFFAQLAEEHAEAQRKALVITGEFDANLWLEEQKANSHSPISAIMRDWDRQFRREL